MIRLSVRDHSSAQVLVEAAFAGGYFLHLREGGHYGLSHWRRPFTFEDVEKLCRGTWNYRDAVALFGMANGYLDDGAYEIGPDYLNIYRSGRNAPCEDVAFAILQTLTTCLGGNYVCREAVQSHRLGTPDYAWGDSPHCRGGAWDDFRERPPPPKPKPEPKSEAEPKPERQDDEMTEPRPKQTSSAQITTTPECSTKDKIAAEIDRNKGEMIDGAWRAGTLEALELAKAPVRKVLEANLPMIPASLIDTEYGEAAVAWVAGKAIDLSPYGREPKLDRLGYELRVLAWAKVEHRLLKMVLDPIRESLLKVAEKMPDSDDGIDSTSIGG
jgi:hypothetical protein